MKKNGFKLMQELNQFRILDMIRKYGPISRSDLAKRLNLSPTTVATAVSEFIKEGMAIDGQQGHSRGGRKPILVSFVPHSRFLIGVSITNSTITLASMDMEANVIKKSVYTISILDKEDIVDYIVSRIVAFVEDVSDLDNCIGISIIAPGIVDSKNGVIRKNTKFNFEEVPLKALVEERTGLKTWLDNDANAIVLAEKQFGTFKDKRNLIYIQLGEGLGAGMIMNGEIFRGRDGGAGEFGHISLDMHGPICECGNAGCLDYYVGWPAIYGKILSSLTRGKSSVMLKMVDGDLAGINVSVFLKALTDKDDMAQEIAGEMASHLSAGLVTMAHLLNPDVILIGWDALYHDPTLLEAIQSDLKEHSFALFSDDLEVHPTTLGEDFQLKGAAAVLLQDIFNFSI